MSIFRILMLIYRPQFGGELFLLALCCVGRAVSTQGGALKRIVYGGTVGSQDDLKTYHYVSIRKRFACISNQVSHEVRGCQEVQQCGGTLFREDFVITAAHCVYWNEFFLQDISNIYDTSRLGYERFELEYFVVSWGQNIPLKALQRQVLKENASGHFFDNTDVEIVAHNAHKQHAFYTNLAMLAGSTDAREMEQIRHAFKKFIHPYYGKQKYISSLLEHDVALVQVCEAFKITQNVRLAPMKPLSELTTQYEKIVQKSAACLYVGFGLDEGNRTHYIANHRLTISGTVQMKYTWRQVACSSKCNWNRTLARIVGIGQPRNPCKLCSDHIPPYVGTPAKGDSGGPILCDGFYMAVIVAGNYNVNRSEAPGYPLHCIRDAITPERLDHYRKYKPPSDDDEDSYQPTLDPVLRSFTRLS